MKRNFFYFGWREFTRSANFSKNMAAKGVLIFLALYFSASALVLGFALTESLAEKTDIISKVAAFNAYVFVYAGFDLVLRVMMQNLPTIGFQPFLTLPVKRKRIARYLLNKSVFHFFNVLPLFMILPFTFKLAVNELSAPVLAAWLAALIMMIFVNHFLAIYIKWRTNESNAWFYGFLGVALVVVAINRFGLLDLNAAYGKIFDLVIAQPAAVLIFPVLIFILYYLNQQYLWSRFYTDELSKKKADTLTHDFSWLGRVGEYGKMLTIEVKMIARNKRPRTSALMSLLFVFYGLLLYQDKGKEVADFIYALGGMIMTGMFSMTYGQFFPGWHGRYYPLLMVQKVKMKEILQSAFFLMAGSNVIYYLLSLGYMFFSPKVFYIHLAVMLYNVGVNTFVIFALGLNSRKAVELEQRASFNYQGMSATNWLITFPVIFGPFAVFGLIAWLAGNNIAFAVLGGLGIIGIILHPKLIDFFAKEYTKRKHKMVAAYKAS
jgi:hypothetical protein